MSLSQFTAVTAHVIPTYCYLLQVFVVTTTGSWTMNGTSGRWIHAVGPTGQ